MCARNSDVEIQYTQLEINHLNDTPSSKAAGGGIYSGMLLKDLNVPVKVRRTLSSVGTSSSNNKHTVRLQTYNSDARHHEKKADLQSFVKDKCKHLSADRQRSYCKQLINESPLDGTLDGWKN